MRIFPKAHKRWHSVVSGLKLVFIEVFLNYLVKYLLFVFLFVLVFKNIRVKSTLIPENVTNVFINFE